MQYAGEGGGSVNWVAPGPTPNAPPGAGNQNSQKPPANLPAPDLASLIPNAAGYGHAKIVADNALRDANIQIGQRRSLAAGRMGYLLNPDGTIRGVDPNNPQGTYQIEKSNEAAATLQGLAQARGGWGGGMVANALQRARQGINMGMTNLNRSWNDQLQNFIDQGSAAQVVHDQAVGGAWTDAWNQGIASGNYDPVTGQPIPGDTPAAGSSGPAPYTAGEMGGGFKAAPTNHSTPNIKAKPLTAKAKTPPKKAPKKAGRRP